MPCLDYEVAHVPAKGAPVRITDRSGVARYNKYMPVEDVPEKGVVAETWGHPSQCYVQGEGGNQYFTWATQIMSDPNQRFDARLHLSDYDRALKEGRIVLTEAKVSPEEAEEITGHPAESYNSDPVRLGGSVVTEEPFSEGGLDEARGLVIERGWGERVVGVLRDSVHMSKN